MLGRFVEQAEHAWRIGNDQMWKPNSESLALSLAIIHEPKQISIAAHDESGV
jgi:hypothetical protein